MTGIGIWQLPLDNHHIALWGQKKEAGRVWIVILCLASILLGFAPGRRLGIRQGFRLGMAYGRLDLRRQSLEQNRCPICSLQIPRQEGAAVPIDCSAHDCSDAVKAHPYQSDM